MVSDNNDEGDLRSQTYVLAHVLVGIDTESHLLDSGDPVVSFVKRAVIKQLMPT